MPYRGICIGFVSGKGGTGKTCLLAGIGAALAGAGHKTLCVDCDTAFRNLDLALGLSELALMDFSDVISGRCTLEDAAVEHPARPGLFLLNAPVGGGDTVAPAGMNALAARIRQNFDFCLMDAPSGMGEGFSLVTGAAERILLVAEMNPLSVRDAQRVVTELDAFPPGDVHLIVNRVRPSPFRRAEITVDDIMDAVGLPLAGLVPEDGTVSVALRRGVPVTLSKPDGAAARACRNIARRVAGEAVPLPRLYR
ncbi:MAG: AAA family ATPase [Oscillibacter sp.]|nr:AAA family ATPase [Oscillibacter sp.]